MPSSYSTDLKLELMATGENSGTWGDKTNTNLNLLQQAIAGFQSIALTSTNTTLAMTDATISDARNAVIKFTGTLAANTTVFVASGIEKTYIIENGTSGAFTLALNQVGGASAIFGSSDKTSKLIYLNGTDAVDLGIVNLTNPVTLTNKTLTSAVLGSPTVTGATISLGANLSTNANNILFSDTKFIADANTNELVIFSQTASAVNEVTLANAATGNNPNFTASGGDTNVGINFTPKGVGAITFNGMGKVEELKEKVNIYTTATTGTMNFNFLDGAVEYHTGTATGQFTLNLRGSSATTLNTLMSVGESMTGAYLNTNSTFYVSTITIDGSSTNVTLEYQGGSAPTSGNAGIDVYSFTVIKTATTPAYTILAAQTQFN
jgi:hypothetical protein